MFVVDKFWGSVVSGGIIVEVRSWCGDVSSSSVVALFDVMVVVGEVWVVVNVVGFLVVLSTVVVGFAFLVVFWGWIVLLVDVCNFVEAVLVNVVSFLVDFDVGAIEDVVFSIATGNLRYLIYYWDYDVKKQKRSLNCVQSNIFLRKTLFIR